MLSEFSKDSSNGFYVALAGFVGVNQNVIKVHKDKNIRFFYYDFVDIVLEAGRGIKKT